MQPKVNNLKSRYVPVFSTNYVLGNNIHWWKDDAPFYYPNVLINLDTATPEQIKEMQIKEKDVFLLTDSGGFQAIRGDVNFTWLTSLQRQINLGASKLFSFDKPPVKRKTEGQNIFEALSYNDYIKRVEENLDVAIQQSKWLQQNHPDKVKDFCYVLHATSKETLDYNIKLIEEKIGWEDFDKYFGGVCYAIKKTDYVFFTTCCAHAKKYFVDNGYYVHFLGIGSFNKMIVLIKFGIDTFDSSNALRGAIAWQLNSPVNMSVYNTINKQNYPFVKQFCLCPVCQQTDYNELIDTGNDKLIGRWWVAHNLWQMLKVNMLLDSLDKTKYTEFIREHFKINKDVKRSLDYIDDIDKYGLEEAYEKYKHYIKTDESKQKKLF